MANIIWVLWDLWALVGSVRMGGVGGGQHVLTVGVLKLSQTVKPGTDEGLMTRTLKTISFTVGNMEWSIYMSWKLTYIS